MAKKNIEINIPEFPDKNFLKRLPINKESKLIREKGIFVFDACSLLSIYLFSKQERKEFIDILNHLSKGKRLWIPYQFLYEFENHRLEKIESRYEQYNNLKIQYEQKIDELKNLKIQKLLEPVQTQHLEKLKNEIDKFSKQLLKERDKKPDLRIKDPIKKSLIKSFGEKIGDPYSRERHQEIFSIGNERYEQCIPPGYMDRIEKNKTIDPTGFKQYGDLIAWFQIIDYAKLTKRPIAIVTEDIKEDWWIKNGKELHGPRIELMYEIKKKAGVPLAMFTVGTFLHFAKKSLQISVPDTLIKRVEKQRDIRLKEDLTDQNVITQISEHVDQNDLISETDISQKVSSSKNKL